MPVLQQPQDLGTWQLESDLASLACQAAIEFDNLILDRPTAFDSASRLVSAIRESLPQNSDPFSPNSLLDPTAVLIVNRAIGDAIPGEPLTRVDALVRRSARLMQQLTDLIANPQCSRANRLSELKLMRSLCLALSKRPRPPCHPPRIDSPSIHFGVERWRA